MLRQPPTSPIHPNSQVRWRKQPMQARKMLMLFFTSMAVALVVLTLLFNLLFKNVDVNFETRIPESAPTLSPDGQLPDKLKGDALNKPLQQDKDLSMQQREAHLLHAQWKARLNLPPENGGWYTASQPAAVPTIPDISTAAIPSADGLVTVDQADVMSPSVATSSASSNLSSSSDVVVPPPKRRPMVPGSAPHSAAGSLRPVIVGDDSAPVPFEDGLQ